jgi:small subunit ribosomal protein S1
MVTKPATKPFKDIQGGPPPPDESWWEAVLMEEETGYQPPAPRPQPQGRGVRSAPARNLGEAMKVDWDLAMLLYEQDKVESLQVSGYNRGGLLVCGEALQGFVPVSHLVVFQF